MTADIRTAAQREAERRTIEPNVDDPLPVDHHTLGWRKGFRYGAVWGAARVTPTREQIASAAQTAEPRWQELVKWNQYDPSINPHPGNPHEFVADAVLALIQELAEGK